MAKQLVWSDPQDPTITLPASYWRPVQINISIGDKSANFVFYGYRSATAAAANPPGAPVGQKSYPVSGAEFLQFKTDMLAKVKDPIALVYDLATNRRDVVVDPLDATKNVSFFATALDV